jgi:hypothetical protein
MGQFEQGAAAWILNAVNYTANALEMSPWR